MDTSARQEFSIIEDIRDLIYVHDLEGKIVFVNNRIEKLTGFAREELIGKSYREVVDKQDWDKVESRLRKTNQEIDPYIIHLIQKGGGTIEVEVSPQLVRDKRTNKGVVFGIGRNPTDSTRRRERDKKKQAYSRTISTHEMYYILTSIAGICWYLENWAKNNQDSMEKLITQFVKYEDRKKTMLDEMRKETKDVLDKVGDNKSLAELIELLHKSTELLIYDADDVEWKYERTLLYKDIIIPVTAMIRNARFRNEVTFDYDVDIKSLEEIYVDKGRFRMVFFNVLLNATKYCDPERRNPEWPADILVRVTTPKAAFFQIHVMDYGLAIPEDEKEKVFDPEFRTEVARERDVVGKGFGLYIARKIVTHFGGRIYVSQCTEPTILTIELPRKLFSPSWFSK
ncbi:MAG: PAS domain S-box protein [Candidatus Abyssobacteria bacterium SURF_17]|uniref:histidine kinase n=1 Tax=Candidatus Abyssobacteria bacterium SURF_17 TaxID=2093361 RepID=A0A419EU94_9BACT|nr:MAG: PAS domain S-box protein [Candidatus Abyssubacteria bacterium SURF_17]